MVWVTFWAMFSRTHLVALMEKEFLGCCCLALSKDPRGQSYEASIDCQCLLRCLIQHKEFLHFFFMLNQAQLLLYARTYVPTYISIA
jgi:hypothetical protein